MKANDGSGNNESRDEWETPKWLFDKLDKQYNFNIDCCATEQNKKRDYIVEDFLDINYSPLSGWMNPPFSKAYRMFEHFFEVMTRGVAIYRCDNFETKIWQEIIFPKASWVFIINKRIAYEGQDGNGARFPSALIGFNVDPPKHLKGTLLIPNCEIGGTKNR